MNAEKEIVLVYIDMQLKGSDSGQISSRDSMDIMQNIPADKAEILTSITYISAKAVPMFYIAYEMPMSCFTMILKVTELYGTGVYKY